MARPLRYEAAGAVYHVMARGDRGKNIFDDDNENGVRVQILTKSAAFLAFQHRWGQS